MAYDTGSAVDLPAIVSFIQTACTTNGWTLSGQVLHKGSTYVRVWDVGDGRVGIHGGTGIDGSNNLTGGGPQGCYLGTCAGIPLAFPLTAEIHINTSPDEVFVVINFSTSYYEIAAWGISDVPGLTGSGVWYHATRPSTGGSQEYESGTGGISNDGAFGSGADGFPMFSVYDTGASAQNNSYIHGDVDGLGWNYTSGNDMPSTFIYLSPLYGLQPNAWNGESILLPYPIYTPRAAGNKYTLVGDLKHIRLVRIDFMEPEDIITLGADEWKVYPWFRKNASEPGGGNTKTHSGTLGYALRYTGP